MVEGGYYGLDIDDFTEITTTAGSTYLGTYRGMVELNIPYGTDSFIELDVDGKHSRYIRADEIVAVIRRKP